MSRFHDYHQPNAPDSQTDESDSDIELGWEELNPRTQNDQRGTHKYQPQEPAGRRIPLRSLRGEHRRGIGRQNPRLSTEREDKNGAEDAQSLLQGNSDSQDSQRSFATINDDAPLLDDESRRFRESHPSKQSESRSSNVHLPRFIPNGLKLSVPNKKEVTGSQQGTDTREIIIGQHSFQKFPQNVVSNAKYTPWSFLPLTLYNEFSFFYNMYFLLVALSQIIPPLRIGYLSTYVAPLVFVLAITLGKEALDDIGRRKRDSEANQEEYTVLEMENMSQAPHSKTKPRRNWQLPNQKTVESSNQAKGTRLDAIDEEEERTGEVNTDSASGIGIHEIRTKSRDLRVGDILKLGKDQRVPADLVILKSLTTDSAISKPLTHNSNLHAEQVEYLTRCSVDSPAINTEQDHARAQLLASEATFKNDDGKAGEIFIRTDQLDGETDWKLRLASPLTQSLDPRNFTQLRLLAAKPDSKVNDFFGTVEYLPHHESESSKPANKNKIASGFATPETAPLTIDNTAWANTVLASNISVLAAVIYTGRQTRQAMSTSTSRSKTGLLDHEINNLTKILCALTLTLSITLVALEGFENRQDQKWYVAIMRFLILFSTIIPISLRVNLDMGKSVYAWFIERDQGIPGTIVRTSTIPEELGRVEYLLSDKTGTLTQNEMELKKIHVGTVSYANEAMDEVTSYIQQGFSAGTTSDTMQTSFLVTPSTAFHTQTAGSSTTRTRREIGSRIRDVVLALALCHNVTPTTEEEAGHTFTTYQASSPDEIAIVRWTESVGLRLIHRDRHSMTLQSVDTSRVVVRVRILDVFPFTSEGKRMGIVLQFLPSSESSTTPTIGDGEIWFYQKGADTVMRSIVSANDWLDEETANMAREGLRTLVVGRRKLSPQHYQEFASLYKQASLSLQDRDSSMGRVVRDYLENNLELLGVTGVEDRLQKDVKSSLELLRNAGIKIWMLTGDKVETARCVAISAKLVSRNQYIHTITNLSADRSPSAAVDAISLLSSKPESTALLLDGTSLSHFLTYHREAFISLAVLLPAVVACRCSPTQKAEIATLIRQHTRRRVACIGDGGNDVSMIQAADVGIGIVGKEGRQASLAADFSITQFHHLTKLLVWHGRNSYKRSAKLAQFVIHRGLIISVCQTMYSIATHFEPHALYRDWLLVGYATVYTMAPVFSLVLDKDVDEALANLYPELYRELTEGRSLSYRTFFVWCAVSIYQGGIIQGLSQILVHSVDSPRMVSVSFSVLVLNELLMVAAEIVTWHRLMLFSLLGTLAVYVGSVPFLGGYFDLDYVASWAFAWRVTVIAAVSLVPVWGGKLLRRRLKPPSYRKVQGF